MSRAIIPSVAAVETAPVSAVALNQNIREGSYEVDLVQRQVGAGLLSPHRPMHLDSHG